MTGGPTLSLFQSLWAMEDLPYRGDRQWTLAERVEQIAGAGFAGLAVDLGARQAPAAADVGPLAEAGGLRTAVFAFVSDTAELDTALRYADQIGAPDMVVCGVVFDPDPAVLALVVEQWHGIAARAGVRLQLETHRGTMTNDLRMTTRILAALDPAVDLSIDLSHHVCGCELPDRATDEVEDLIDTVLARAGSLQGRVASRGQVQLPLTFPAHQAWVERFRGWWTSGFRAILARDPQADIMFCTELGTTPYAITGADGHELSDRWAEAQLLCEWARASFSAATTPPDSERECAMTISSSPASITGSGNRIVAGPLPEIPDGRSILPARAYTGQLEFDHEQEAIFASGWVWAGYEHWAAVGGDVIPVTIAGRPLMIVRGDDGEVRVFHNSCRHRGMMLTEEPIQVTKRIQCAYHCWSYHLDGTLAAAPFFKRERRTAPDAAAVAGLGLLPVASATWAGMVFVNLSPDPQPFLDLIAPLQSRWQHIDLTRVKLAQERKYDIRANWKLIVENFLDFYHLPFIHPQVGPVAASLDVDDVIVAPDIIGGCYPRGAAGKAKKSADQLPWLGDVPADRLESQDIFCVFPNALLFLEADWFQVIGFEPMAADHTIEHMAVFVDASAASEDYSAALKSLCEVLYEVNEQDLPILRKLQAGRHSPGSDQTSLLSWWDQITAHFQALVRERAGYPG